MGARPLEDRVAEVKAKREKIRKKLDQYDEQIKRLEKKDAEEKRKQRTHSLIVCGAEIAALFEKVLDQDEIYSVINFLREQRDLGNFTLEKTEMASVETEQETIEKRSDSLGDIFGGLFDF